MPVAVPITALPDQPMSETEHAALRAWLTPRLGALDPSADRIVGAGAEGRSRRLIAQVLILWLQDRPKG